VRLQARPRAGTQTRPWTVGSRPSGGRPIGEDRLGGGEYGRRIGLVRATSSRLPRSPGLGPIDRSGPRSPMAPTVAVASTLLRARRGGG